MKLQDIISAVQEYHPDPNLDLIHRAYTFVREKHQGQTRASGEPYITHVTEVAYLAAKLRLDVPSIATALLHDTVEDTGVKLEELAQMFSKEIAELVDGVTKLSRVNFSSREEQQAENFRKMLLAMAKDIRVLLVKLCDRTHNMRTLEFLSEARRLRIAQETLDIYAPLAHRLGIHWMKSELEDLAFRYLKPETYEQIKGSVNSKKSERERYISRVVTLIKTELEKQGVHGDVAGRPKHYYSIYQKMERQGLQFDEIHDLTAFRILVPSTMECYGALGVIHAAWKPIPGRFKDYIAMPKANKYQSLHTTVVGPDSHRIEIQIRTPEMHDIAERGIAAHWFYKARGKSEEQTHDYQFPWLKELVESEKLLHDPYEFLTSVKQDLFASEVFVFSPKGDVVALTYGSTPIDFAYHVHTDVGHRCTGARVNGQQVPLTHRLRNGDAVEIITSKNQIPSKDWLDIVVTSKAKQRIRSWLKNEERVQAIAVGREVLTKDLRRVKLSVSKAEKSGELSRIAEAFGFSEIDLLFAEVGYGKLSSEEIVQKLLPDTPLEKLEDQLAKEESALQKIFQRAAQAMRGKSGIKISGMDDMVFRFAKCCDPLPGDELVGYISRGRGVAVHKRGCTMTMSFDPRRLVPVSWDDSVKTVRRVKLQVFTLDKVGVLAKLTNAISANGANMAAVQAVTHPDGKALTTIEVNVESAEQLETIVRSLERIDGVLRVERTQRG